MFRTAPFALGLTLVLFGMSSAAHAHSRLMTPAPLTQDDNAKSGPCGCYFGAGPEDPTEDGTPSACPGTFTKTDLVAGEKYTVVWQETVNHTGSFRLSISTKPVDAVKKADVDDPVSVIYDEPDANGTSGGKVSTVITVPNTPCDSCTLQLRQFMSGATTPYYYSCASIRIIDPNATSSSSSSTGAGGASGVGGASGSGAGGASGGGTGGAPDPSTGAGQAQDKPAFETGACSVGFGGGASAGLVGLGFVALAVMRRRRARVG